MQESIKRKEQHQSIREPMPIGFEGFAEKIIAQRIAERERRKTKLLTQRQSSTRKSTLKAIGIVMKATKETSEMNRQLLKEIQAIKNAGKYTASEKEEIIASIKKTMKINQQRNRQNYDYIKHFKEELRRQR